MKNHAKLFFLFFHTFFSKHDASLQGVYISAPGDEQETISKFKFAMDEENLDGVKVFSFKHGLEVFVDKVFHKCDYYKLNKDDIVSLVEMEVCTLSKVFLRSAGSSWSSNIQLERTIHSQSHMDMINLELFMENHEDKKDEGEVQSGTEVKSEVDSANRVPANSVKPKMSQRQQFLAKQSSRTTQSPGPPSARPPSSRPPSGFAPSNNFNFAEARQKPAVNQQFQLDESPYSNGGVLKFKHESNSGFIQNIRNSHKSTQNILNHMNQHLFISLNLGSNIFLSQQARKGGSGNKARKQAGGFGFLDGYEKFKISKIGEIRKISNNHTNI